MRPLIIKDKYIGKDKIESFKDFTLEDNYFIKEQEEGFKIEGKIVLKGNIHYLNEVEELYKEIEIDALLPFEKLESRHMIKLVIENADFSKNDNVLLIKIKIRVEGEDDVKENLIFRDERKMEFPPEEEVDLKINEDFVKSMEELLKTNEDVDVITTLNEEPINDFFDIRVSNQEENQIEPLPLVEEEPIKQHKDSLLKTEYVKSFFFYIVNENETIYDILNKFNMTKDDYLKLNKSLDIKPNDLIQIKVK